jgi:hypothetical protein
MEIFLGWLGFSLLAGWIARNKGNSFWGYFLLSIFLSPLLGIIAALVSKSPETVNIEAAAKGKITETHRPCPFCAEPIRLAAKKCPHCQTELGDLPMPESEAAVLARYGINKNGNWYVVAGQSYASPEEAITEAKKL